MQPMSISAYIGVQVDDTSMVCLYLMVNMTRYLFVFVHSVCFKVTSASLDVLKNLIMSAARARADATLTMLHDVQMGLIRSRASKWSFSG